MKKKVSALIALIMLSITLCACGSSESTSMDMTDGYVDEQMAAYAEEVMEAPAAAEGESSEAVRNDNRKLIKTVDLSVQTTEYQKLLTNIEEDVKACGGYIENLSVSNKSPYSEYSTYNNTANITARIPAKSLDAFVNTVGEKANVINRNEFVEDVTLSYVDMESHKKMLQEEQNRLMYLLEEAYSLEDIITIESRLSEVRYQIESMESQLRTFDNQIDYSTVTIHVEEVKKVTPQVEQSAGQRIKEGFLDSLDSVLNGVKEFFIQLVIASPYLIVWAIVIGIVILVVYKITKISEKRAKKNAELRKEKMLNSKAGQKAEQVRKEKESTVGYPYQPKPEQVTDDKNETEQ